MHLFQAGVTSCPYCSRIIESGQPAMVLPDGLEEDGLATSCGESFHWECFLQWPSREAFASAWVEAEGRRLEQSRYGGVVFHGALWWVALYPIWVAGDRCGAHEDPTVVVVFLPTLREIVFPLSQWSDWLESGQAPTDAEAVEWEGARQALRTALSSPPALAAKVSARELLAFHQREAPPNPSRGSSEAHPIGSVLGQAVPAGPVACPKCGVGRERLMLSIPHAPGAGASYHCLACSYSAPVGQFRLGLWRRLKAWLRGLKRGAPGT